MSNTVSGPGAGSSPRRGLGRGFEVLIGGATTPELAHVPVEQIHARHILISQGQPGQSGKDQARAAVEQEKQKQFIEDLVARSRATVADTFNVTKPEPQAGPQMPPGMGGPPPGDPDEPPAGPPPAQQSTPKPKTAPAKPEPKKK